MQYLLIAVYFMFQIVIASIMCAYIKEDWTQLAQMAEVWSMLVISLSLK